MGNRNQIVDALEFIVERQTPMRLDEVAALRPILAEKEPPQEFLDLSKHQSLYIGRPRAGAVSRSEAAESARSRLVRTVAQALGDDADHPT